MGRRTGQIEARGDRRWLVRWFVGTSANGRRRYASKTVRGTKRDAQQYLNSVLRSLDVGQYVEPSKVTLDAYLDRWLESAAARLALRTVTDYRWQLARYVRPVLGSMRLDQIRPLDVQRVIDGLVKRVSARTVRLAHNPLNAALNQAVRWRMIPSNPAALVDLPKQRRREMLALSTDQISVFREASQHSRHALFFDFMLGTGCRPGEVLGLRWADVDLEHGRVAVRQALTRSKGRPAFREPKAGSRRTIPLPHALVGALSSHRKVQAEHAMRLGSAYERDLDLVFANKTGLPLDSRNLVQRYFKPVVRAAGLPAELRLYDLRHSHATALLSLGVHPKVAAERLGHSSTRMTMDVYSHVLPGMQERATAQIDDALFGGA